MVTPRDYDRIEKILSQAPFFNEFPPEELELLIQSCQLRRFAPREAIWAVGVPGEGLLILLQGRVERTRRATPAGQQVDQFGQPGALLGLSYLAGDWKRQSTATALEHTELLILKRERFQALLDNKEPAAFRLADKLAEELVQDMREANRRLQEVFGNPAETLRTLRRRARTA